MRSHCFILPVALALLLLPGCGSLAPNAPDAGHGDTWDTLFRRRHADLKAPVRNDPMLSLAREITVLEDDIRRDGSITVKTPDVWGDADLMHYIQEYDGLLAESVKGFNATLQAYIARSDQMELQSATGLGMAIGGGVPPVAVPASVTIDNTGALSSSGVLTPPLKDFTDTPPSEYIAKAIAAAPAKVKDGIGVEPTELERQRSTFILVNQALRRRNTGDDGSRAAGYALYKFRVPVSILPGRETHQGHSAVVTLRAQLHIDEAHLRYTFPKLVIADLVETLTPAILEEWDSQPEHNTTVMAQLREVVACLNRARLQIPEPRIPPINSVTTADESLKALREIAFDALKALEASQKSAFSEQKQPVPPDVDIAIRDAIWATSRITQIVDELRGVDDQQNDAKRHVTTQPVRPFDPKSVSMKESIIRLRDAAREHFHNRKPRTLEMRNYLFTVLGQVHSVMQTSSLCSDVSGMQTRPLYSLRGEEEDAGYLIQAIGQRVERGDDLKEVRRQWLTAVRRELDPGNEATEHLVFTSWLVAVQSGILNQNLHRILEELRLRGKLNEAPECLASVQFFTPDGTGEAVRLWDILIRETFPLHVFALDPEVEEQNVYDAFSRRREMQLALAISVASGRLNAGQRIALSRQLAMDEATIAMNRTAVAFSHGSDTFGWYFYPRVQTPPTESSNIGAVARMIWSTGPTECYDLKHRKLEPGMRECEVLVAMPSFVTEVSFDVTTNWESLAHPGVTKRSYEEMVAQGGRLQRLRVCLQDVCNQPCYRPGDYERLLSRIDQLEQMLGMQTYLVDLPYEYEQTGTDLFDTGKTHLRPVLHDYYGLEFVQADGDIAASLFLTGKNFHPALTHVIVGGTEVHGLDTDQCEVVSRELLRVKITKVNSKLSQNGQFQVRVGTPAGLSEPLVITAQPTPPPASSAFDWKSAPVYKAYLMDVPENSIVRLDVGTCVRPELAIVGQPPRLPLADNATPRLVLSLSVKFKSGREGELGVTTPVEVTITPNGFTVDPTVLLGKMNETIAKNKTMTTFDEKEGTITGIAYLQFDPWPYVKFDKPVTVEFQPRTQPEAPGSAAATDAGLPSSEADSRMQFSPDLTPPLPGASLQQ